MTATVPGGDAADTRSFGELADDAVRGARWVTFARVVVELALLASMVVLARLIPPEQFGFFAIALIVQEIALTTTGEGIGTALVQRRAVTRAHLQAGVVLALGVGLVLCGATLLSAPHVFGAIFGSEAAHLAELSAPMFLLGAAGVVPQAILQRRLNFRLLSLAQVAGVLVRAVACVALALAGLDGEALVIGALASTATATAIMFVAAPAPLPMWRPRETRELASFGVPAALAGLSWTGFRNADYAIVGGILGPAQVGLYWRAYQLAVEYQRKLGVIMYQVAFPIYSRAEDFAAMFALRRRGVRLLAIGVVPLLAFLAAAAPTLVPWVFGPEWAGAVVPTQILAVAGIATLLNDALGAVLMAAGRPRMLLAFNIVYFLTYAGVLVGVAPYGLVPACVAVAGVQVLFTIGAYGVLLRGLVARPLRDLWSDIAAAGVSAGALVAVAAPVEAALRGSVGAPALLALLAAVASSAYLLVLRLGFPAAWHDLRALAVRLVRRRADVPSVSPSLEPA